MKFLLQEWMDLRGLTQGQLARGLGITTPSVNAWLKGRERDGERKAIYPDIPTLERLCLFLDCSPGDLLKLDHPPLDKTWRDLGMKAGTRLAPSPQEVPHGQLT